MSDPKDNSRQPLDTRGLEQLMARRLGDDSPVFMINLLEFEPAGGGERYAAYARGMVPVLAQAGASIPIVGSVVAPLRGEGRWDLISWILQRSRRGFLEMTVTEEYKLVSELRADALARSELRVGMPLEVRTAEDSEPTIPSADPDPDLSLAALLKDRLGVDAAPGPVLLHELVELEPGDGTNGFARFLARFGPLAEKVGGRVLRVCRVGETLKGGADQWDFAVVSELPTRQALIDLSSTEEYRRAEAVRAAAVRQEDVCVLDPTADWRGEQAGR